MRGNRCSGATRSSRWAAAWNGHNSERAYCEPAGVVPVRYCHRFPCFSCRECNPEGFCQHDRADALIRITAEDAALPFPAKVLCFIGLEALRNLTRTGYPGAAEVLAKHQAEVSA